MTICFLKRNSNVILCASIAFNILTALNANAQSRAASITPLPINPACSAFLQRSSALFSGTPISSNDVKLRYVSSETITKKAESPISFADFQTGVAFKQSRRISIGVGELIPPVSVKRKIEDIPIVVLKSVNLVNLDIDAQVKYGISLFGGYLLNEQLALGAGFSTRQIQVKAKANTSSGERLLNGQFLLTDSALRFGLSYHIPRNRLRLGAAASLLNSKSIKTSIETSLVNESTASPLNNNNVSSQMPLGEFVLGAEYSPNRLSEVFVDLVWKRANKNEKEFSLVDLQEKTKDVYDTVSIFLATKYRAQEKQYAIASFTYEPSPVGSGSPGPSGKSGFGMRETALLYSGFGDLLPAWSLSFGLQYGEGLPTLQDQESPKQAARNKESRNKDKNDSVRDFWSRSTISVSFKYRRASLGVDEAGELPAAYSQNRIQFPISLQSTF